MSTYGYEIALSYNDSFKLAGKPFNFGIKATLADYYSIIDRYNNASRKLSDYYEGQRLGEIWGFVCNGLFQSQAEIDAAFGGKGGGPKDMTQGVLSSGTEAEIRASLKE